MSEPTIHATAVAVGAVGVLIRGAAGSGKSSLALALVEDVRGDAALIADDRVVLASESGRLVASAPSVLVGLIEVRGIGLVHTRHQAEAVIGLIVDLVPAAQSQRLPEPDDRSAVIDGITLPRLALPIGLPDGALRVRIAIRLWVG